MTPATLCSRDAAAVAQELGSDAVRGLTTEQARDRLDRSGPNELVQRAGLSAWRILLAQVTAPILLLLIAAGVLSAALGDVAEALVIAVVVVLNVWIGLRQEYRAQRAMASLQAMVTQSVTVVRDGTPQSVDAREVVRGDVARLETGAHVPADGRLVEAVGLRVDESALTGESAPVDKQEAPVTATAPLAERASMSYSGTTVTAGRGSVLVSATGMSTELGRIAELLDGAGTGSTPLQQRLDVLVRRLALLAGVIVLVVFMTGLLRGEPIDVLLLTAVSLAVAAVPESLPAVVTITLALGAQRMLGREALIRRLYAVETLGSVTTICSDKTGTLTQNAMTVVALDVAGHGRFVEPAHEHPGDLEGHPAVKLLLTAGALCNDTVVGDDGALIGDPTETALVAAAQRHGLDVGVLGADLPRVFELPFDSARKLMTTVHTAADQEVSFTKGAPAGLLGRCDRIRVGDDTRVLDEDLRGRAQQAADELAARGIRVLGVATGRWPGTDGAPRDERLERGLTFLGLQGMVDPARPEVRGAIDTCRAAGVRVMMITGDHPLTAAAIGRDLGIVSEDARVVTGAQLGDLDAAALDQTVREVSIYARVAPEHKLRIVAALQRQGEVVAMTGDGVNDAPALKQSDIGVAMGITGTDVTKDAADMVLLDDDFATIVGAVGEGRVVFDNIRKFIRNILSGNVAEVSVMVLAPVAGMPLPLLPLQILWLNLVTDGLPAMALAVEPPEAGVMVRPPTPLGESLLGADRGVRILLRGAALTLLTLIPAYLLWRAGDDAWQTVLFTAIAFAELAGGFAMRSEQVSLWRLGVLSNRPLVGAVVVTLSLQVVVVKVGLVRDLLGLEVLDAAHWALVVAIALAYLGIVELDKRLHPERVAVV